MRRLSLGLVAAVCTVALTQVASAQSFNWTGFYIGGNVGYSWGRSASTLSFVDATSGGVLSSTGANSDLNGIIGGVQTGYNRQINNWVYGVEADIQASGQNGSTTGVCAGGALTPVSALSSACAPGHIGDTAPFNVAALPVTSTLNQRLDWFGTLRGRIGPTITPTLMVYATGGLAYGQVSSIPRFIDSPKNRLPRDDFGIRDGA